VAGSCGKVGDPRPPITREPAPPFNVKSVLSADRIQLTFSLAQREFQAVEVFRECGKETVSSAPSDPVVRLAAGDITPAKSGGFSFEDTLRTGQTCFYSLRVALLDGRISRVSDWIKVESETADDRP